MSSLCGDASSSASFTRAIRPSSVAPLSGDAPACEAFSGLGRKNCEHWFFYTHANALVACELTSEGECKAAEPVFCRVRDPHVTVVRGHAR